MPRASQIYLVYDLTITHPLAAFTVKYESQNWAEDYCKEHGLDLEEDMIRVRLPDGRGSKLLDCPWEN